MGGSRRPALERIPWSVGEARGAHGFAVWYGVPSHQEHGNEPGYGK